MATSASKHTSSGSTTKRSKKKHPKLDDLPARRGLHKAFILYSILAILVSLWMALGQVLGAIVYETPVVGYVLRVYVVAACLLLVLVELEITETARTKFFHHWISRGLVYVFIGVIGMQENETAESRPIREDWDGYEIVTDIVRTVAWNMTGCGVVYVIMGMCCLQYLLDKMRRDYQARLERARTRDDDEENAVHDDESSAGGGVEVEYYGEDSENNNNKHSRIGGMDTMSVMEDDIYIEEAAASSDESAAEATKSDDPKHDAKE